MSRWSYGLVKEGKRLVLCEVYADDDGKFFAYCYVTKSDLRTKSARKMALQDLKSQLKFLHLPNAKDAGKKIFKTEDELNEKRNESDK